MLTYSTPKVKRVVDYLPTRLSSDRRRTKLSQKRDTYRYTLKNGPKIVYIGVTTAPESRENSHRQDKNFDRMKIEGPKVSKETALEWEQEALERYRRGHGGRTPKYND
jgi:predicted GIY-YIG superfamily endonuclease